jgi:hypothetical protein
MYGFSSQVMSYILNQLIYVDLILLDNVLQCLLFIIMIDLSRTYDNTDILICNALVMFIIYPWIKIKPKALIFSTIQKPYCRHFCFMAEFIDVLKPVPFTGANFERWQMRAILWLTAMNVFWVSKGKPEGGLTHEKEKVYSEANTIFCGAVVGALAESSLQDMYIRYKTTKEMWDILNTEYGGSDASTKLYIIEQYHDYQMVDGKSVVTQTHEI